MDGPIDNLELAKPTLGNDTVGYPSDVLLPPGGTLFISRV